MSAMGDGLNAGAATFTPGVPGSSNRSSAEMNDDSMLDEIEAELDQDNDYGGGGGGGGYYNNAPPNSNANSAYPDLPPHADEFWFPECRNCPCCNGYKHGCQCCAKEGLRSCKCTGPGPAVAAPPPPQAGGWMPAAPGPGTGGGYNNHSGGGRGGGYHGGGGGRGGGGRGPPPCRFFNSPGGCRFGDNCRFSHG